MGQREDLTGRRLQSIIDAAYRCLVRDGYTNVSIKDIAREASVAPGLLHYYFESKEQLLVAVVREVMNRQRDEFFDQLRQFQDLKQGVTASIAWIENRAREDPAWFVLLFELYTLSLRDEHIRVEVRTMLQEEHAVLAEAISAMLGARPEKTGLEPEALAALALAVFDGLLLHAMIDPTVDPAQDLLVLARAMTALLSA
jgi:AcrR family transcriptional regulator